MTGDVPLFSMARAGDPETSHEAAASVADVRRSQQMVWNVLSALGPQTDEQLVDVFTASASAGGPRMSPSGVRSRRAELVRVGLVRWTGERRVMRTGRAARVWEAIKS